MSSQVYRLAIVLLIVCVAVYAGCKRRNTTPTDAEGVPEPPPPPPGLLKPVEPLLPRRLLFISMTGYAALNPLAAPSADQTKRCADKMAAELKVPHERDHNQTFIVTDLASLASAEFLDKKSFLEEYERFLDTCRPQEHIVLYFGGHALEVGGKAYLATVEASPADPRGFIPLADFYSKLKACKAAQKVVIWDVCRLNPSRRPEGKGSEPMTATLSRALTAAPPGVEVITTCQPGENALEFRGVLSTGSVARFSGSSFLEAICAQAEKSRIEWRQTPSDPIPVADWIEPIVARVSDLAARLDRTQTVRYFPAHEDTGRETRQEKPKLATSKESLKEAEAIEAECRLPPFTAAKPFPSLAGHSFPDDVIRMYKADVSLDEVRKNKAKYPFRITTLNALQTVRDVWVFKGKGALVQREYIPGPVSEATKRQIKQEQGAWSIGILRLEEADRALEEAANERTTQPKRWQAHYDYARAVVKARLAFMNEYNKLMGDMETETIPPLDKAKNQNAYHLVSTEKMKSRKDVQKIAADAAEAFETVIAEHKDTPWAVLAEHEKSQPLGLAWEAVTRK